MLAGLTNWGRGGIWGCDAGWHGGDGGQSDGGLLEVSEEHRSCDVMMFEQEQAELNLLF